MLVPQADGSNPNTPEENIPAVIIFIESVIQALSLFDKVSIREQYVLSYLYDSFRDRERGYRCSIVAGANEAMDVLRLEKQQKDKEGL